MLSSLRGISRNTIVLAASIGWVLATYFAWNPLLPLHMRRLGASDGEIGVIFTLIILCHTVPAVAGGWLADRFGRKWIALGPGLLLAPLYVAAGLTTDWRALSVFLVAANLVGSVQWPAMQAMISESDEATRAKAFSLIEVFVLSAAVVGPLLGSLLLPFVGVGGLLVLDGLSLIPATWVRARELRETHRVARDPTRVRRPRRLALSPTILWIMGAYTLASFSLGLSAAGPFYAIMARDVWGLADQQIQQVLSISSLAAFGGVWLGSRADRWGARRMWIVFMAGFAVSLVGWGLSATAGIGAVFMMLNTLFFEALYIVWETLLARRTTSESRSLVFGLCGSLGGGMQAAGPAAGTWLVGLMGLPSTFLAGAAVAIGGAFAVLPVSKEEGQVLALEPGAE